MGEKALLIRLGALGDTLHAAGVAGLLKAHDPDIEVDFLSALGLHDLFSMIPSVSNVFELPFRKFPLSCHPWWRLLLPELNDRHYQLIYLMETNPRFLSLLERVKADRKIALEAVEKGQGLTAGVPNAIRYQRVLWHSGLVPEKVHVPRLVVGEAERKRADELIRSLALDPEAPLVGLHPGNSFRKRKIWKKWFYTTDLRSWPEERWIRLILDLGEKQKDSQFILFGGREVDKINRRIAAGVSQERPDIPLVNTAGMTDLPLAAALLKWFSLFISTDTGPIHMAAALKVPLIGLYGPTRFEETRPLFDGSPGVVLRKSFPCQPCYGTAGQKECQDNICMQAIEINDVVTAALEIMS